SLQQSIHASLRSPPRSGMGLTGFGWSKRHHERCHEMSESPRDDDTATKVVAVHGQAGTRQTTEQVMVSQGHSHHFASPPNDLGVQRRRRSCAVRCNTSLGNALQCTDLLLHRWRKVHKDKMTSVVEIILATLVDDP